MDDLGLRNGRVLLDGREQTKLERQASAEHRLKGTT